MKKKIFLQLFLFGFFLLIIWIVFKSYDSRNIISQDNTQNDEVQLSKKKEKIKSETVVSENKNFENTIASLSYSTTDEEGNRYSIYAKEGKIDETKPNIINMKGVEAKIEIVDEDIIYIYSENAIFDNINFNSKFTNDVKLIYLDHNLTGKQLDLDLEIKLVTLSNKVVYRNLNTELNADYMILDLIMKTSEISMYDKSNKVKIFQLN